MIIILKSGASTREVSDVVARVEELGFRAHLSKGEERTIIGVIGDERRVDPANFALMPGVDHCVPILRPFKLASRDLRPENTVIRLGEARVGSEEVTLIAGPCAVESRQQLLETAWAVKEAGARVLRGGAFKPRTSPYSFQGLGQEGLEMLAEAREATGLPIVTEVVAPHDVPVVAEYADVLQIGARQMQNFSLLHAAGESGRPVLLKRGNSSTMEELLMSAEYILTHGNYRVMLCERGIRTFETYTRNTVDINAVPVLKELTHLPVLVDPSHGTGQWKWVPAVARAAIAAGADGLIIEVHPHPDQALSDGAQSLKPETFQRLVLEARRVAEAVGRTL